MKKEKSYQLAVIGLTTALICVLSPWSLPVGVVPISLGSFAVLLAVYLTGMKRGVISTIIYLLIGTVGVPVFSSFGAGIGKVLGPTGGYMLGYIFMGIIAGLFFEKNQGTKLHNRIWEAAGMALGVIALYILGTAWLAFQAKMTFAAALAAGVLPFIVGDIIKIIAVILIGYPVRKQLKKANLL